MYYSLLSCIFSQYMMGFFGNCKPGAGWVQSASNKAGLVQDFRKLLKKFDFDMAVGAHGGVCTEDAHAHLEAAVDELEKKL